MQNVKETKTKAKPNPDSDPKEGRQLKLGNTTYYQEKKVKIVSSLLPDVAAVVAVGVAAIKLATCNNLTDCRAEKHSPRAT